MAMPRSAWASAGASLTPSPTIATTAPPSWRRATASAFPAGSTPAITCSIPTSAATACAACSLSPVRRIGRRPSQVSSATASALVGLTVSARMKTARARPSQAAATAVLPSRSASSTTAARDGSSARPRPARSIGRPTSTSRPPTRPSTPRPLRPANDSTASSGPRLAAAAAIARPAGCSEAASREPASRSASASDVPGAAVRATSDGRPRVTVPVLSSTTVSIRRVDSSTSGPRIRMPELGAAPGADEERGRRRQPERAGAGDDQDGDRGRERERQARHRSRATRRMWRAASASTIGTNTAATRSASRCTGAFPTCASSTSAVIRASAVSEPTRCARTTSRPPRLTVAAATSSPGPDVERRALTREQRAVEGRAARGHDPVGGDPLAGPDDEQVPHPQLRDRREPLAAVGGDERDVLRAELGQREQRGARAALGARLEESAGEQEGDDEGRRLEVDAVVRRRQAEPHRSAVATCAEEGDRDDRPAPGDQRAERDERVHRRGAVAQGRPGGVMERPAAPQDDRGRERESEPLPAAPGGPRRHPEHEHRHGERGGDDEARAQARGRVVAGGRLVREPCLVADARDRLDERRRRQAGRVVLDGRPLGRVVDRGLHAVEPVQRALDPRRAGGAAHAVDRERNPPGGRGAHGSTR